MHPYPATGQRSIWADRCPDTPCDSLFRKPPRDAARRHYVTHAAVRMDGLAAEALPGENGGARSQLRVDADV